MKVGLQTLVIFWWTGAAIATVSLFIPIYNIYFIMGSIGWAIVILSTAFIIYEIKRIKQDDRKKQITGNQDGKEDS